MVILVGRDPIKFNFKWLFKNQTLQTPKNISLCLLLGERAAGMLDAR